MNGVELIAAERERQIAVEGWTPEHDDEHDNGEMASAAVAYAGAPGRWDPSECRAGTAGARTPLGWPWDPKWWKPTGDAVRDLAKAGALIAAEIDRLQRAGEKDD